MRVVDFLDRAGDYLLALLWGLLMVVAAALTVLALREFSAAVSALDVERAIGKFLFLMVASLLTLMFFFHVQNLVRPLPALVSASWSGKEAFTHTKSVCFGTMSLGTLCVGVAWMLRAESDPVAAGIAVLSFLAGIALLVFGLKRLSAPMISVFDRGIEVDKCGLVEWSDVEAIRLSTRAIIRGGKLSFLLLYVADTHKYTSRLPRWHAALERFRNSGGEFKGALVVSVDGLSCMPSYVYEAASIAHSRFLAAAGKRAKVKTGFENLDRLSDQLHVLDAQLEAASSEKSKQEIMRKILQVTEEMKTQTRGEIRRSRRDTVALIIGALLVVAILIVVKLVRI